MVDFPELTPEQAAANIRGALATFFQGTKRDHDLLDASLAMCGLAESAEPSTNGAAAVPS